MDVTCLGVRVKNCIFTQDVIRGMMLQTSREGFTSTVGTRRGVLALAASCGLCGIANATEDAIRHMPIRTAEAFPVFKADAGYHRGGHTEKRHADGIVFGDSIQRLISAGVLDVDKLRSVKRDLSKWVERALTARSDAPIVSSGEISPYLVDLLWPIGLANKAAFNEKSPINTLKHSRLCQHRRMDIRRSQERLRV